MTEPTAEEILAALERTAPGWQPRRRFSDHKKWYEWREHEYPTLTELGKAIIARESEQPGDRRP